MDAAAIQALLAQSEAELAALDGGASGTARGGTVGGVHLGISLMSDDELDAQLAELDREGPSHDEVDAPRPPAAARVEARQPAPPAASPASSHAAPAPSPGGAPTPAYKPTPSPVTATPSAASPVPAQARTPAAAAAAPAGGSALPPDVRETVAKLQQKLAYCRKRAAELGTSNPKAARDFETRAREFAQQIAGLQGGGSLEALRQTEAMQAADKARAAEYAQLVHAGVQYVQSLTTRIAQLRARCNAAGLRDEEKTALLLKLKSFVHEKGVIMQALDTVQAYQRHPSRPPPPPWRWETVSEKVALSNDDLALNELELRIVSIAGLKTEQGKEVKGEVKVAYWLPLMATGEPYTGATAQVKAAPSVDFGAQWTHSYSRKGNSVIRVFERKPIVFEVQLTSKGFLGLSTTQSVLARGAVKIDALLASPGFTALVPLLAPSKLPAPAAICAGEESVPASLMKRAVVTPSTTEAAAADSGATATGECGVLSISMRVNTPLQEESVKVVETRMLVIGPIAPLPQLAPAPAPPTAAAGVGAATPSAGAGTAGAGTVGAGTAGAAAAVTVVRPAAATTATASAGAGRSASASAAASTAAPRVPPAAAGAGAGASPAAPPAAAPPAAAPAPAVSFGIPVPEHPTLAYVTDLRHLVSVTLIRKLTEQYAVEHAAAQKKGDEEEVMRCLSQIVTMEKLKSNIEAMVKSGKLSLEDYMSMVEGQAEKDKLALSRLAATEVEARGILTQRIGILTEEVNDFKEAMADDEGEE